MQWVPNTTGFRGEVTKVYVAAGLRNPMLTTRDIRADFEALQSNAALTEVERVAR
jgi:hypothetical protein